MALRFVLLLSLFSVLQICYADQPVEEERIVAKKVQLLGGWATVSPERAEIQDAAKKAVEHFNLKSKTKKYFRLLNVSSAEVQVTNMINYKITATLGKTKCLKSEDAAVENCDLGKKRLTCKFEVQFNPRNDRHQVNASSCKK
ncbi:cystatin-1 [Chanos chanos]|uniref:Cystatin-1 n=1 Tax=Chanos chanos TaxID=29144 RepID=A0A6J2V3U2_CHACN|nr:cystatin-1-like [Chanos chanos]